MACDAQTLIATAYAAGYAKLSERDLKAAILASACAGGGGGGGGGAQLVVYTTTDPTTDGKFPTDQTKPAMAYKLDGTGPTFVWNTTTHVWN